MKILLASPRGFCAGVNMAIESLDLTLSEFGKPVYVYHEIVHNKYVVESFKKTGAIFVDHLEEVPPGSVMEMFPSGSVRFRLGPTGTWRNLTGFRRRRHQAPAVKVQIF